MRVAEYAITGVDQHVEDPSQLARRRFRETRAVFACASRARSFAFLACRNVPDHHCLDSLARLGPVKALRFASTPHSGAHGLDRALGRALFRLSRDGREVMRTFTERSSTTMRQLSITPSITVTIGRHTRICHVFVTTAPADLDLAATVTLHPSTFLDVVGFVADPIAHDTLRARTQLSD
jgi:hypothetical protein